MITPKQKIGSRRCCCCCFPWQVGMKKSMAKTVPLEEEEEGLEFADMKAYTKVHSSSWKWRSKSKSNSFNNTQINSTLNQSLSQHDTRQHAASLPSSKRQHVVNKTTGKEAKQKQDHVTGACMVIISLVSMIVWGGLVSIVCTTSFMYLIPFLKTTKKIP
ncbi:hypothetical protein PHAVU_011G029200 [Phaseolus vulgaris]|uniref:Uncharacterized protein n=1 Tax=Phaseolus vulgaris TaxID=3885 RepID=V7ADI9_PHAVU|nr:hypothetical protein PHAVU_011G029200g [Phaseolus vulgaris]ESW03622.1 hypothetical protein PHAVU_011G029200g [Phaseolus vulgaris]